MNLLHLHGKGPIKSGSLRCGSWFSVLPVLSICFTPWPAATSSSAMTSGWPEWCWLMAEIFLNPQFVDKKKNHPPFFFSPWFSLVHKEVITNDGVRNIQHHVDPPTCRWSNRQSGSNPRKQLLLRFPCQANSTNACCALAGEFQQLLPGTGIPQTQQVGK